MKKRFLSFILLCLTLAALTSMAFASNSMIPEVLELYCSSCKKETSCTLMGISSMPTCSWTGSAIYQCSECGLPGILKTLPVVDHDYSVEARRVEPTCIADGAVGYFCSYNGCNKSRIDILPSLGHDYVVTSHTDPTCTASGSTVTTCSRCDDEVIETIAALGHDYAETSHTDPTCTDDGFTVKTCSRCEDEVIEGIAALGHDYTETSHIDPTCIASGSTVTTCSRCDDEVIETISALGHDYAVTSHTDPTCTASGSTVKICSRCDDEVTEAIAALNHDYAVTSHTDATCTATGSIVKTCSRCDDVVNEAIPALGHDYVEMSRTDATCIESGSVFSVCSRCEDAKVEELPVLYHSWDTVEMVPSVYDDEGEVIVQGYTFYSCYSCESQYTAAPGMSPPVSGPVSDGIGMKDTTAALGKTLLSGIWALFSITVPGFGFTFGQMWLGVLLCSVSILVIRMIFGFGGGSRGQVPRTSSTNNPRISKERRHDQF